MLLGCGSVSSWVRRLVACVGFLGAPYSFLPPKLPDSGFLGRFSINLLALSRETYIDVLLGRNIEFCICLRTRKDKIINPVTGCSDWLIFLNKLKLKNSRNCFGCAKSTPITAVDEPSKGLRIQGRSIKHRSLSEDFWSTSPREMENSALQSQRSMSSISTAAQSSEQHGAGSSSNPNEFVNQGLLLWNQTRQQWVGNRRLNSQRQKTREPKIGWNATYESLLGSTKTFAQPIPLGEMVDFLVDGWEQEGLYD